MAEESRESCGNKEDYDQNIPELLKKDRPRRDGVKGLQLVRALLGQATRGLDSGEPLPGGVKHFQHFVCGQLVPVHGFKPVIGIRGPENGKSWKSMSSLYDFASP